MTNIALTFKFKDIINGPRFQVGIKLEGRVRLVQEQADGGEFWIYGVNPGGLAEHGETPEQAYGAFRRFFKEILEDFAAEAENRAEFVAKVQTYLDDRNDIEFGRWEAARVALQGNAQSAEGVFTTTPKVQPAGAPRVIECLELKDGKVLDPQPPPRKAPAQVLVDSTREDLALAA